MKFWAQRIFDCLLIGGFAINLAAGAEPLRTAYGPVPPLSFRSPDGRPAGFTIDVFNEAARRAGIKLAWIPAGPSLKIEADLKAGALDIVPAAVITPERQRMFYVSDPWWFAELSLLTRTGLDPASLNGKRLALGSPVYRYMAEKEFPGAIQVPFPNAREATLALCRGNADSALMMHMDVHDILFSRPDACEHAKLSVIETSATQQLAIMARPEAAAPARQLRRRIDEMALDGTLAKLAARYPIPSSGVARLADDLRSRYSRRLWRAIAIFALILIAVGLWFMRRLYRDIRARKRAQAELETSQARLATSQRRLARAHRIAGLGDWEIDLATGEVDLSDRARDLFHSCEDHQPRGWDTFLHCVIPEDADRLRDALERAAAGQSIDINYTVNHSILGRRYLRQNAQPLREGGRVVRVVGTIQDMTEYRELEMQLRQAQKIESVGQLAGGVAHDFNNLLTVISGHAGMLLECLPPGANMRGSVEEIAQAADRAASLTRQLLTFSRREMFQPKVLELNEVIRNIEKMLRRLIGEDIDLALSLDANMPAVLADPGQIEQVIVNLVVNARDAMPGGGKLIVRTANRTMDAGDGSAAHKRDFVELTVTDTGTGIRPENIPRIFEPFFTTKERGKGTGLGLSMVYGIVKQSGGSIRVRSELGLGTTFEILLPATESAPDYQIDKPGLEDKLYGHETILVVEDETGVRNFVREVLASRGYNVLEASNGREGLNVAQSYRGHIDVLLTDVVMPEMGGMELSDRFSELHPETVILYMSGYLDRAASEEVMETMLQKPFTPSALLLRVRDSLSARGSRGFGSTGTAGA